MEKIKANYYDNGGLTNDRYAVVFQEPVDGEFSYATLSPTSGIYNDGSYAVPVDLDPAFRDNLGDAVTFDSLPESVQEDVSRLSVRLFGFSE